MGPPVEPASRRAVALTYPSVVNPPLPPGRHGVWLAQITLIRDMLRCFAANCTKAAATDRSLQEYLKIMPMCAAAVAR